MFLKEETERIRKMVEAGETARVEALEEEPLSAYRRRGQKFLMYATPMAHF